MMHVRPKLLPIKLGNNVSSANSDAPNLQVFSFNAIKVATNNFSSKNKLGQGGFGPVYKVISGGIPICILKFLL